MLRGYEQNILRGEGKADVVVRGRVTEEGVLCLLLVFFFFAGVCS